MLSNENLYAPSARLYLGSQIMHMLSVASMPLEVLDCCLALTKIRQSFKNTATQLITSFDVELLHLVTLFHVCFSLFLIGIWVNGQVALGHSVFDSSDYSIFWQRSKDSFRSFFTLQIGPQHAARSAS